MDKKRAIELLKQALNEIPSLEKLHYDNQEFKLWRSKINDVIKAGLDKDDYNKYTSAYPSAILIRGHFIDSRYQQEYIENLTRYETAIKSIIQRHDLLGIEEETIIQEEKALETPIKIIDVLKLHPKVIEVSRKLFQDGHYRDAIYRAFVEVNNCVKAKSKKELDGKGLMSTVFSLNNPIIRINPLVTQSDKDEQEGFMYIFMGAMEGIRNPKAHENIVQNDPHRTLWYLGLASLLMKIAEEGKLAETA